MSQENQGLENEDMLTAESREQMQGLDELSTRLEDLDSGNRELYEQTLARYDAIIEELVGRLRDRDTPKPDKGKYVRLKKEVAARRDRFAGAFPELVSEDRAAKEKSRLESKAGTLFEGLEQKEQISDEERSSFKRYYHRLPTHLRGGFLNQLKGCLKNKDQAGVLTGFRAILFELSRRALVESQGKETLGEYNEPIVVPYSGYDKKNPHFDRAPTEKLGGDAKQGDIQIDVHGIIRDGKPLIYETKAYPRRQYGAEYGEGESAASRNQLLKYQKAIEEGKVAGATVEIQG